MSETQFEFWAAVPTPMHADGRVDAAAIPRIVETMVRVGVDGAFVCGTTGEGPSLDEDERRRVSEAYVAAIDGRLPVIVHVGCNALPQAWRLAAHAAELKVDGIAAAPPVYFRPDGVSGVHAWCRALSEAAGGLPLYYYHFPLQTGVELSVAALLEADLQAGPVLAGAKFTHGDLPDFQRALRVDGGRYKVFFGRDSFVLPAVAVGARAFIGSTYLFAVGLCRRAAEAHARGESNDARALHAKAVAMTEILMRAGGLRAIKAVMAMADADSGPCRLPLETLDEGERRRLRAELEAIGFFDWRL